MIKHIKLFPLFIGIVVGILAVVFVKPEQKVIYKYPTPVSCGKTTYKDKNGVCYKYSAKELDCDKNEDRLKMFPLNK